MQLSDWDDSDDLPNAGRLGELGGGSVVFVVDVVVDFIGDSVVVLRVATVRQLPFQEPVHRILASGQLAGDLNPCLKVRAFLVVECRRVR